MFFTREISHSASNKEESKPLLADEDKNSYSEDTTKNLCSLLEDLQYYTLCLSWHPSKDFDLFDRFIGLIKPNRNKSLNYLKAHAPQFSKLASEFKILCEKKEIRKTNIEKCNLKISALIDGIKDAYQEVSQHPERMEIEKRYAPILIPLRTIADAIFIKITPTHEYKRG
jgi:hypothetical protein